MKYSEYSECEIAPELEVVRSVLERLRSYCTQHGLDETTFAAVELAVAEGLNNAIEHGCVGFPDGRVLLRWTWDDDTFEAQITDPSSFLPDPDKSTELPDDPFADGGRGTFLMHSLMDTVEHRLVHGQHTAIMRKRIGGKTSSANGMGPEAKALVQSMAEDLSANYENINALLRFAEQLAVAQNFEDFCRHTIRQLVTLVSGSAAILRLARNHDRTLDLVYPPPADAAQPPGPALSIPLEGLGAESRVFATGQPHLIEHRSRLTTDDPLYAEVGSACACSVRFQGVGSGVLTVFRPEHMPCFSAVQVNIIRSVAKFVGIAWANARLQAQRAEQLRAMRELEIAAEIQQLLLPRSFPDLPKTRIYGVSTAAREVGGDYFDIIPVENEGVLVAIADVMGKGMPAALLATIFRSAVRARHHLAPMPGLLLTDVNQQIKTDLAHLDMFITAQVAFFPYRSDEVAIATAGHCPVLKYLPDECRLTSIDDGGVPLGVLDDVKYETTVTTGEVGSRFIFLTDGLYEVDSPAGDMLGIDALQREMLPLASGSPAEFCGRLLEFVRGYTGEEAQASDDRTLVVVERI